MKNNLWIYIFLGLIGLYFYLRNNQKENEAKYTPSDNVNWDKPIYCVDMEGDTIYWYKYDEKGNCIEYRGDDFVTTFEYDENNFLVKEINEDDYQPYIYEYLYDSLGRLSEIITDIGVHYTNSYQGNKRISHKTGIFSKDSVDMYYEEYFLDDKFTKDTLFLSYKGLSNMQEGKFLTKNVSKYHENGALLCEYSDGEDTLFYEFKDNARIDNFYNSITYYEYK